MNGDKKKIFKSISVIILIAFIALVTVLCIPLGKLISSEEGRLELERIVSEDFVLGVIIYLLLMVLQIVVAILPGGVVQILGGVLFGGIIGTLLCISGVILGTCSVYYLVKAFGKPLIDSFFDEKIVSKYSFLQDSKKLELVVFILFLIPGIPKDLLTYIAPLTKIKFSTFLVLSTLARIPAVILSTVFGSSLGDGNYVTMIIVFLVVALIGIIGILYKDMWLERLKNLKRN